MTKNKSDIISTIVSRCQSFFVASNKKEDRNYDRIISVVENYFNLERNDVLEFNDSLYSLCLDNDSAEILCEFENYILHTLKNNINNGLLKDKLIRDLKNIEIAQKELKLGIQLQTVIETLCFNLIL